MFFEIHAYDLRYPVELDLAAGKTLVYSPDASTGVLHYHQVSAEVASKMKSYLDQQNIPYKIKLGVNQASTAYNGAKW